MCTYTKALAIHVDCRRNPPHQVEKLLYKRCGDRPKPGPRCDNPTFDPALPQFLSQSNAQDSMILVIPS
ncbi:hypothetical protein E4U41_004251, partial [Claviceps citrina]